MFSVGAGLNVNVQEPWPSETPIGPPAGSHPHQGPVIVTSVASEQTVAVITKSSDGSSCANTLNELNAKTVKNNKVLNFCKNNSGTELFLIVEFELISLVFG